jgi:hypothetical protein
VRELGLAVSLQGAFVGLGSEAKRVENTQWSKGTRDSINIECLQEISRLVKDSQKMSTKRERGYKPLTFKADLGEDFCALKVVKAEAEETRRARAAVYFILF